MIITQEWLKKKYNYNPETGRLLYSGNIMINQLRSVGRAAGYRHDNGYVQVKLKGVSYPASRLIWMYVYGEWPINRITHINGVRHDNSITNLRLKNKGNT